LSHLLDDGPEVRTEAALALARMGDARAVPRLLEELAGRDHALAAAEALRQWASLPEVQAALLALVGRWLADPLAKVRAAEGLARAGLARGREHLQKAAQARRDDVRGLAQDVLKDLDAH
jgi:HEAT repeat protein